MQTVELPRAQQLAQRAFANLERFLHIEAVSGVVLLISAIAALVWANSPAAASYEALWHTAVSFGIGSHVVSQSLHFWINDGLMTIFFLVVGMEIRREIHEGALSSLRQATLPMAAALGGVAVPALLYLGFNHQAPQQNGWAVPTATDIAFAVGVLALLGKSIPSNIRVFLLALAIIDDIIAVLIIAFFYSGGLDYSGFAVAGVGLAMVIGLQKIGVGSAYAYILPGAVTWGGILMTGAHPTLAGVILGMMTPVVAMPMRERPLDAIGRFTGELIGSAKAPEQGVNELIDPLKRLRLAQRELLPPVVRIQSALHPWVAYAIMPLFALANAGVNLQGIDLSSDAPHWVMLGIGIALVAGKPLGVLSVSWLMVRLGWCTLPAGVTWTGVTLIGLLAGIGFTMSIFIATLAFADASLLGAAKVGVLCGSVISAVLGVAWGILSVRRNHSACAKTH
ncbi:Na+/H+ antiporter NhaA [Pseudomonas sp. SWRI77]|uniref:Na+/H+ antiporter NhaA n=1 Tax=Pseudomonas sp. SWRI77 TaxID=2745485 RepID=UPI001648AC03|nr:Na+/H+ antiporter NhaA [Pseudomonas sp. SWRI77]MBC3483431.1 Na+/H+ antiporter NhaA [Pseudomonas sp. SWRI77]